MKKYYLKLSEKIGRRVQHLVNISVPLLLFFMLTACSDECEVENAYTYYEPVYTTLNELRSSVEILPAEEIKQAGKIYFNSGYLFVNKPNEGIHVIDNREPKNPINISFINVPGSFDFAISNNILYTDSYIDLVAIDITDISKPIEVGRLDNIFNNYNSYGFYNDTQLGLVTSWEERSEVSVTESDCSSQRQDWGVYYNNGIALEDTQFFSAASAVSPSNPGIGGSMARFTISQDHLFLLESSNLIAVNIDNSNAMLASEPVYIDWGIETIFSRNDNVFIGAQNGMHIMDVSSPMSPVIISNYEHITSCDPVIVDGDYAFVTLRSGSECQGFTNQLEVIDISDLSNPQLLFIHEMSNPHGLGKDGDLLFICDGEAGLKIFDVSDLSVIEDNILAHYENIHAYDVIPFNNIAMMIGDDGLYQFDYSDLNNFLFLSKIAITNE
jgi:hypothetical protein